jgi:hypothetical protein
VGGKVVRLVEDLPGGLFQGRDNQYLKLFPSCARSAPASVGVGSSTSNRMLDLVFLSGAVSLTSQPLSLESRSYSTDYRHFDPFGFLVMATVARYIRSHYDPETEREERLLETGQAGLSTSPGHRCVRGGIGFSSGGGDGRGVGDDGGQEEGADPWSVELPYTSAKFIPPVKFVKSVLSYQDVNDYIERGYGSGLPGKDKGKDEEGRRGISDWYRNLSRTNVNAPTPTSTPVPERSLMAERTVKAGALDRPGSLSGVTNGSVIAITQRTPPTASDSPSRSQEPSHPQPRPSGNSRRRSDWFISNVLPHSSSGSGSPTSQSRPPQTLADMLARDPPPNKLQEAYTPPTWITLPPSNPGFRMLQRSGWSEGEPLGPYFARRQGADRRTTAGPSNSGKRKTASKTRTTEIRIEGYDDIMEIKKELVIDLTVSDDEDSVPSSDVDAMGMGDGMVQPFNPRLEGCNPASVRPSAPQWEGHGGKALLTPLPTVLKSDRLGIGLKAKTVGPYKASQKRVTHNAAALAAHVKANEERRLFRQNVGRGTRGFGRAEKSESEKRKNLLAYLNQ